MSVVDKMTRDRLKVRFDIICYIMAKQGLSFSEYLSWLELEAHHGIDLSLAYSTPNLSLVTQLRVKGSVSLLTQTHFLVS